MNSPLNALPTTVAVQVAVDKACDAFEAAWRRGARPSLREALAALPPAERAAALVPLLERVVELRRGAGELPDVADYRAELPEFADAVDAFFAQRSTLAAQSQTGPMPGDWKPAASLADFADLSTITYLGKGGMGVVYQAYSNTLQTLVALKVPRPDRRFPGDLFLRDAQSLARLQCRNIMPVHHAGHHQGQPYFTMKLATGGDLDNYVAARGRDPRLIAQLMVKVARAVLCAHQSGILHRDLKPANILLDAEGEPLVTDFGLATRAVGPDGTACLLPVVPLATGSQSFQGVVGTAAYMSREQANPELAVTTVSDVYGLGAVLYALLTGQAPFVGKTFEILQKVVDPTCHPVPPCTLNPHIDRSLQAICLKALAKGPVDRYQSPEGLARDLERWLAYEEIEARPLPVFHPERVGRWCWRNPGWAALTGVAALLLVLSAVLASLGAFWMESVAKQAAGASNTRTAEMLADNALWLIRDLSREVLAAAQSDEVRELLETCQSSDAKELRNQFAAPDRAALRARLKNRFTQCNVHLAAWGVPNLATMYFLNADGYLVHLEFSTEGKTNVGDRFDGRDYFVGARAHDQAGRQGVDRVHVSRVFHSQYDNHYKFAIAAPVRRKDGPFLGVVSAALPGHPTLGLTAHDLAGDQQRALLVGPVDQNPSTAGHAERLDYAHHILRHTGLTEEQARTRLPIKVPASWPQPDKRLPELFPLQRRAHAVDSTFRDPQVNKNEERLAGLALVGNTGLVVVVHQSKTDAIGTSVVLAKTFVWSAWAALAGAFALALTVTVVRSWLRRPDAAPRG